MRKVHGMIASFDDPAALLHAAEKVRDAGYKQFDCHSPFPIHGMDEAMGLRPSPLGFIAAIGACIVGGGAVLMQWWCSTLGYPIVVSGKPLFSFQAFVPITFELSILGAALFTVFGMIAINRLPRFNHPLFESKNFEKFADDGFLLSIEQSDSQFDLKKTQSLLTSIGGKNVEVVEDVE